MKIFLSYGSDNRPIAARIASALRVEKHEVFFDIDSLPPGESFHDRIRSEIQSSDVIVFLITPRSVTQGKYVRSEIEFARRKWPNSPGHVLPVLLEATEIADIPEYLSTLTILRPTGDPTADVVARLSEMAGAPEGGVMKAKDLLLAGTSLVHTIDHHYSDLEVKLKQGHEIKVLVSDPTETFGLQAASKRSAKGKDVEEKKAEILGTLRKLCRLRLKAATEKFQGRLHIKTTRHSLGYGVHLMNQESGGVLHLKLYTSQLYEGQKPTFVLHEDRDEWYASLKTEIVALWDDGEDWNCEERDGE